MDKSIEEVNKEIALLEERKAELENLIEQIVYNAMFRAAQAKPMNRIGRHCFIVKYSDLIGHPWSPSYYDWEKSIDIVKRFLKSKPKSEWKNALEKKLEETKPGKEVVFVLSFGSGLFKYVQSIPVSPKFIQEIIHQLNLKEKSV